MLVKGPFIYLVSNAIHALEGKQNVVVGVGIAGSDIGVCIANDNVLYFRSYRENTAEPVCSEDIKPANGEKFTVTEVTDCLKGYEAPDDNDLDKCIRGLIKEFKTINLVTKVLEHGAVEAIISTKKVVFNVAEKNKFLYIGEFDGLDFINKGEIIEQVNELSTKYAGYVLRSGECKTKFMDFMYDRDTAFGNIYENMQYARAHSYDRCVLDAIFTETKDHTTVLSVLIMKDDMLCITELAPRNGIYKVHKEVFSTNNPEQYLTALEKWYNTTLRSSTGLSNFRHLVDCFLNADVDYTLGYAESYNEDLLILEVNDGRAFICHEKKGASRIDRSIIMGGDKQIKRSRKDPNIVSILDVWYTLTQGETFI